MLCPSTIYRPLTVYYKYPSRFTAWRISPLFIGGVDDIMKEKG